jgi:hypothetical protein
MFSLRNTTQELNDSTDYVEFKRGIKTSIPMLLGIIPFALVLGTQATQKGFSHLEVPLFTGLNFAGGSEFAVLEVWTNPPNFLVLIFITFLVNSRHLLMVQVSCPIYAICLIDRFSLPCFSCVMKVGPQLLPMLNKRKNLGYNRPLACPTTQASVLLCT